MPLCEEVTITSPACSWRDSYRTEGPPPLIILWQALARPGKFRIRVRSATKLVQVLGCSGLELDIPGPWQLVIYAHGGEEGLPASRPTDNAACIMAGSHVLPAAAAADAMGWEIESLESMAKWW